MDALIDVSGIVKRFGAIPAVDGISFEVRRGEVLGFLGPNGAGKSTTMRMITGFLTPDGGRAQVCGHDVVDETTAAQAKIGYLPEGAPLYGDMTAADLLEFVSRARSMDAGGARRRIDWAVKQLSLESVIDQSIDTLSKGFKRRVGLAQAIVHDPDVLILDEPTDGLDPNQKHDVRKLIGELAREKAIVISTHILEEVDAVCTRAMVINRGRVVADCSPMELAAQSRYHNAVTLRVRNMTGEVLRKALETVSGVDGVEIEADVNADAENGATSCTVFARNGASIVGAVSQHAHNVGWEVDELHVMSGHLDDVFRSMTTSDTAASAR